MPTSARARVSEIFERKLELSLEVEMDIKPCIDTRAEELHLGGWYGEISI